MEVTIEIDSYLAMWIKSQAGWPDAPSSLAEVARLIDNAQREAIVAKASGKKPGEGPWELHPYAARLKEQP